MISARYLGDGSAEIDGAPESCRTYGLEFPVGEWVVVEDARWALKLAGNPMFEVDGEAPEAPKPSDPQPEPEPDPEADEDDVPASPEPTPEDRLAALRAALTAKGVVFHHKTGEAKLAALLAEQA